MTDERDYYRKGELVPQVGIYRCTECGEIWETDQTQVRFPPCELNKSGEARWYLAKDTET